MSDRDKDKGGKLPGRVVSQEPGVDPTNPTGTAVKAPDKVGNMATPSSKAATLLTPNVVGGLTEADAVQALTFRGGAVDQAPDAGTGPTEETQTINLRSGETGVNRLESAPMGRQWQSDIPMNPNQILLAEAPRPDVVDDSVKVEK